MSYFEPVYKKISKIEYIKAHNWAKKYKLLPKKCEHCGKERRLDYANISGNYLKDINDWKCLCKRCHSAYDNSGSAFNKKMQFIDMYVYDFIEKYPEFTLKRLKISRNHWRKNKIKHKIVVDYITSDDTYKKIGIKYNLSVERIRQIVALGIRVMARTQKFKDININQ